LACSTTPPPSELSTLSLHDALPIFARIRGMMLDVAAQLLFAEAEAREAPDCAAFVGARQDDLAQLLFEDAAFLAHAHAVALEAQDRKSTRLNSSHVKISYAVFCLKK